jgi:hypothetical protein
MKKVIIVVAMLLLACAVIPVMAQTHLGPMAALNLANVNIADKEAGEEYSMRTVFGFGGVASFGLSEMMALQFEPAYMQKGTKVKFDGQDVGDVKLTYIDVPVLLKIAFGQSNVKPYALVGGNIGFLMSSKFAPAQGDEQDIKDETESLDYGLNFGAGVNIPMGTNQFFIEAQYALGLSDITKPVEVLGETFDSSDKNTGIHINVGILFPLGGQ